MQLFAREKKRFPIFVKIQMCSYHITFHRDLELEHTLDVGSSGDHCVQVWWRSNHLRVRRSDFRDSTKVPISRDLWPWPWAHPGCMLKTIVCTFGGDLAICPVEEVICAKSLLTDRQTPHHCISSFEWHKNRVVPHLTISGWSWIQIWAELILGSQNNTPNETNGVNNATSCYKRQYSSLLFRYVTVCQFQTKFVEWHWILYFYRPSNTD